MEVVDGTVRVRRSRLLPFCRIFEHWVTFNDSGYSRRPGYWLAERWFLTQDGVQDYAKWRETHDEPYKGSLD